MVIVIFFYLNSDGNFISRMAFINTELSKSPNKIGMFYFDFLIFRIRKQLCSMWWWAFEKKTRILNLDLLSGFLFNYF